MDNLLRTVSFFLDEVVYGLISTFYELLIYIANVDLYTNNEVVSALVDRIYVLLGIFMLFKVAFSIIQYLIDPNAFSDSSKGFGRLLTNTLIAMVALVLTPWIFTQAFDLQSKILSSNALGSLILGNVSGTDNSGDSNDIATNARTMATDVQFMLFGAFYTLNTDSNKGGIAECAPNENGNGPSSNVFGTVDMATAKGGSDNTSCLVALNDALDKYNETKSRGVTVYSFFGQPTDNEETIDRNTRDFHAFDSMLWWKPDGNNYMINYIPLISTLAGGYAALMLILFCLDVAVRAIKLLFLQMVAPIAIISYVDPKESMSNSKLGNWAKESLKTYFSLFLRLAVIFLAFRLIQMISETVLVGNNITYYDSSLTPNGSMNMFVYVFLILGIFMFAKQVPQMIENIFGIKGSGELTLNPFKNTTMAGLTGGIVGAGVGGIASGIAAASVAGINGQNRATAALSGFTKGTISGIWSGRKWDGKSAGSLIGTGLNVSGNLARYQSAKAGTRFVDRAGGLLREAIGAPQKADLIQGRIDTANNYGKLFNSVDTGITTKLAKMNRGKMVGYDENTNTWTDPEALRRYNQIAQYKELKNQLELAQQRGDYQTYNSIKEGGYSGSYVDGNGNQVSFSTTDRFDDIEDANKETMYSMINNGQVVRDDDIMRIESNLDAMQRVGRENATAEEFAAVNNNVDSSEYSYRTFKSMKDASKAVETAKTATEVSDQTENAQITKKAVEANRSFDFLTRGK